MEVIINFTRPGKGVTRYVEGLVEANSHWVKTVSRLSPAFSQQWCEEIWWQNGCIPPGILVGSVRKYLFKREWFAVMQLLDSSDNHLGFYIDIHTPMREAHGEFYMTDLFLDLWVAADGTIVELDRDEFEQGYKLSVITWRQYKKANQVSEALKSRIISGDFIKELL